MPRGALTASGLQGAKGCGVGLICQGPDAVWFDESDPLLRGSTANKSRSSSGTGLKLRKNFNNAGTVSWIAGCYGE
jgi:hypothetical protein